jgi:predicted AlkP superfamily pyrophosphatase or phosphodiesterase
MHRRISLFLLAATLTAADRKVIMISIDGLKGTTLASLGSRDVNAPNLKEIVAKGSVSAGLVGVFPTVTYPSHTTIATGRLPAAHGILGNNLFDPEHKMNAAWYWYTEQINVPTLWDGAHKRGLKTAAVYWPVTVGAAIDYNMPEFREPKTIEDRMLFRSAATPGLAAEFEEKFGAFPVTNFPDSVRAKMAAHLMTSRKPDLLFLHLIDLDHEEHAHGPDAPEAMHTLEQIDQSLGIIRQAVRDAGLEKDTVFVIVSDHGFYPVSKALNPEAVLTSLGLSAPAGKPTEWRIATHRNGGSFSLIARDPKDQAAIDQATKTFQWLKQEGAWGIDRVLTRKDLDAAGGYSDAFLAVSMSSGYSVGATSTGPWLTPSGLTQGTHGFLPGPAELDASFAAFGPGIPAKKLPRAKLVDVAPTVANLLGFTMAGTDGRNLLQ